MEVEINRPDLYELTNHEYLPVVYVEEGSLKVGDKVTFKLRDKEDIALLKGKEDLLTRGYKVKSIRKVTDGWDEIRLQW